MLFVEQRDISSRFIFVMLWSMRMHAFHSGLTNKLVFLLIMQRCLTCLVAGMNTWKKKIKNFLSLFFHADETQWNEHSFKQNTKWQVNFWKFKCIQNLKSFPLLFFPFAVFAISLRNPRRTYWLSGNGWISTLQRHSWVGEKFQDMENRYHWT